MPARANVAAAAVLRYVTSSTKYLSVSEQIGAVTVT